MYKVLSQSKIEDTPQGPRFEILVQTESGIFRSTYVFHQETVNRPVQFLTVEDSTLETLAKLTPEEIQRELWRYLEAEGYDTSTPIA